MSRTQIGLTILRLGLSAVFLWFGFSQLLDGLNWVAYIPDWAVNTFHLPPAMLVLANGLAEVILGALLAMGIWTRIVALLLALHLALITFTLGISPTGVRDFGLVLATLSLAVMGGEKTTNKLH